MVLYKVTYNKLNNCINLSVFHLKGIVGSSFGTVVHTWGLRVKGPVYVALFRPLSIAIAAIMSVIFLGDTLYLGRYVYHNALYSVIFLGHCQICLILVKLKLGTTKKMSNNRFYWF